MLVLAVNNRFYALDRDEVTLGRARENDVVVDDARVSRRLLWFRRENGVYRVSSHEGAAGLTHNGTVFGGGPVAVQPGDVLQIGRDLLIEILRARDPIEPLEGRLFDAIALDEPGARDVYADWLESQGELAYARILRSPCELVRIDR